MPDAGIITNPPLATHFSSPVSPFDHSATGHPSKLDKLLGKAEYVAGRAFLDEEMQKKGLLRMELGKEGKNAGYPGSHG